MGSGTPAPSPRPGEGVKPLGVLDQRERSARGRRVEPGDQASVEERDLPVNTPVEPEVDAEREDYDGKPFVTFLSENAPFPDGRGAFSGHGGRVDRLWHHELFCQ
jgi:hypothetical protein